MKTIFIFAIVLGLVLSQGSTTTTCTKPCYKDPFRGEPCPTGSRCGASILTSPATGCSKICYPEGANDTVMKDYSERCVACQELQCTSDEKCTPRDSNGARCYNCDPIVVNTPAPTPTPTPSPCPDLSTCTNTCPGERKIDSRGCRICDCAVVCPAFTCNNTCANGYKVDSNGCKTCDCKEACPDLSTCTNTCPGDRKVDSRGCKICDCAEVCPAITCNNTCANGYKLDSRGCRTCDCKEGCAPITCDLYCSTGFVIGSDGCKQCKCNPCPTLSTTCASPCKAANGCPTCECNTNNTCLRSCPYGYKVDPNTGARTCDCKCPETSTVCAVDCRYGFARDANGCEICDCKPPPDTVCTTIGCEKPCTYGYKLDTNGCKTCDCLPTPTCETLASCDIVCRYGRVRNERGCETCVCNPCPKINCTRICEKGYKRDSTGCEVCDCADTTSCNSTGSVDATTSAGIDGCNLNCTFGYVVESGCKRCVCRSETPCKCGERPTETKPCLDGSRSEYTSTCVASADNKCAYFFRKCPYAIRLVLTKGTFTNEDLKKFLEEYRVDIKDVKFEVKAGKDGSQEVTFFVQADAVPEGKKDEDVAKDIATSATLNGNTGYAYVISGDSTSTGSFGNVIIVSVLGMILALIM